VAIVLCVVVLLVALSACTASSLPWLLSANTSLKSAREVMDSALMLPSSSPSLDAYGRLMDQVPVGRIWLNTLVPPLISVLLQVVTAYVGALGIGALRPLKRWSELLLLPFSPWLFVTTAPLSVTFFLVWKNSGLLDTMWGLIPPIVFSVPMLFILTMFFKGQVPKARAARSTGQAWGGAILKELVLPSLPLVVLLACLSLLFSMQDLMWQVVVARSPENSPANVVMLRSAVVFAANDWPTVMAGVVLFGLPPFLLFFPVLGLLQALYLDRLALVGGKPDEDLDESAMPDSVPEERARETVRLEEETERKTVRLEEEGAKVTRRLEPEEPKVTKRLEPESERKTVRLGEEDTGKTARLEPEEPKVTRRLEPEEPKVTRRLEPEEDDTEA
jgi:ABC-type glycerol-3-phosphate transport system permease component